MKWLLLVMLYGCSTLPGESYCWKSLPKQNVLCREGDLGGVHYRWWEDQPPGAWQPYEYYRLEMSSKDPEAFDDLMEARGGTLKGPMDQAVGMMFGPGSLTDPGGLLGISLWLADLAAGKPDPVPWEIVSPRGAECRVRVAR